MSHFLPDTSHCIVFRKSAQELEKIGLKWSVLSTTSWQAMYDALCDFVKDKKKADPNNEWDGNVPANHKTEDNPPLNLGRWVNRQRSAYSKQKLKQEFVDKLNEIGLKWAVHERRSPMVTSEAVVADNGENEKPTISNDGSSEMNGDGNKVGNSSEALLN